MNTFRRGWITSGLVIMIVWARPAKGQDMVFPGAEWARTTPESQRVDASRLDKAANFLAANTPGSIGTKQMVIIRNGRMIWEGANANRAHEVYSVTKSVTSTVMGRLIDDGLVSLDTRVADYLPALENNYGDLTLQQLVNMTSPYRATGESRSPGGLSDTLWTPDVPVFQPAGAESYYSNVTSEVLSRVLTLVASQPIEDVFRQRIADRIGMTDWSWSDWGRTGNATPDGIAVNRGSHGLYIAAEQAARFGHLFLNEGRWDNDQVVNADWIRSATSVQPPVCDGTACRTMGRTKPRSRS